jgi:hypothetical protein
MKRHFKPVCAIRTQPDSLKPVTRPAANPHIFAARVAKAARLAAVLREAGCLAAEVATLSRDQWAMAATVAGCEPPHSAETAAMVAIQLAALEIGKVA